jgi:hypothetical protein
MRIQLGISIGRMIDHGDLVDVPFNHARYLFRPTHPRAAHRSAYIVLRHGGDLHTVSRALLRLNRMGAPVARHLIRRAARGVADANLSKCLSSLEDLKVVRRVDTSEGVFYHLTDAAALGAVLRAQTAVLK